jgi:arginyl-tRNA synthetase
VDFYKVFYAKIKDITNQIAKEKGVDVSEFPNFVVESPKNEDHGDIATNVAMVLCKSFGVNPMQLAEIFKIEIEKLEEVASVQIAKPAFINIIFKNSYWYPFLNNILVQKENFGKSNIGNGLKVSVEYVSANPTGPLHVGHGRGAVLGDIVASIYEFFGYYVTREYYINDAGGQIDVLANSLYYRYAELLNSLGDLEKGENFYPGEYLINTAKKLISKDGDIWLNKNHQERIDYFKNYAIKEMMEIIKEGLAILGVKHDLFSSEKEIATEDHYNEIIKDLTQRDLVYIGTLNPPKRNDTKVLQAENFEAREQKLFRSTYFGDDVDRALEKSNGERTYFANDMVYHNDKVKRGYDKIIDVLGADHIGYIKRIQSAVDALSNSKVKLEGVFCQLVNLLDDGKPLRMSKRAGNFITLSDLVSSVGKDIFRFMMITRKNDVSIDLDVNIANQQTLDNPVFYIQYAYARINSVLENAKSTININKDVFQNADFSLLEDPKEIKLLKSMLKLPKFVQSALDNNDPHRIYLYLMEVSAGFHALWNAGKEDGSLRFIIENNEKLTISRLSLIMAASICIKNMLSLLGVNIKEKM